MCPLFFSGNLFLLIGYPVIMADQQFLFFIVQVHAIAFAVTEHLAVGAYSLFGPAAVAIGFEAIVPDVHEVILINVSLMEVRADTGATGNGTVYQHRSYTDAGVTFIESVAYLAFIIP